MNISDVAKKTGLTSKAIRFYEEKGLVTPPLRSENGYCTYTQNAEEFKRADVSTAGEVDWFQSGEVQQTGQSF